MSSAMRKTLQSIEENEIVYANLFFQLGRSANIMYTALESLGLDFAKSESVVLSIRSDMTLSATKFDEGIVKVSLGNADEYREWLVYTMSHGALCIKEWHEGQFLAATLSQDSNLNVLQVINQRGLLQLFSLVRKADNDELNKTLRISCE